MASDPYRAGELIMNPGFVFFDIGNVLVYLKTERLLAPLNRFSDRRIVLKDILNSNAFKQYELGRIRHKEFFSSMRAELGIHDISREHFFYLFGSILEPGCEMLKVKNALLMNGLQLGIISNNNPFHMWLLDNERKFSAIMDNFKYKAISCRLGMRKPDPQIFQSAAYSVGMPLERCILVDDMIGNINAFRELGGIGYHFKAADSDMEINDANIVSERMYLETFLSRIGLI